MNAINQYRQDLTGTAQAQDRHKHSDCAQPAEKLRAARTRLATAKDGFSKAAVLALQGHDDAAQLTEQALTELNAARVALHGLLATP